MALDRRVDEGISIDRKKRLFHEFVNRTYQYGRRVRPFLITFFKESNHNALCFLTSSPFLDQKKVLAILLFIYAIACLKEVQAPLKPLGTKVLLVIFISRLSVLRSGTSRHSVHKMNRAAVFFMMTPLF